MSARNDIRALGVVRVLFALALCAPSTALAGGIEYAGQGARGLARGGATKAKAEDVQVLINNPAGLAEIRGTMLQADFHIALMDACVDPIGYYGWGVYGGGRPIELTDPETGETETLDLGTPASQGGETDYYLDPLDTVCLTHMPTPIPQAAWATRVNDWFGIGFGVMFPSITPQGYWGGRGTGVIRGDDGDLRPSPLRYMKLSSGNVGLFPTLGVGFKLFKQLRLGASFQWGILSVHQRQMAAAGGGTFPTNDVIAEVRGVDWFVPSIIASAHIVPIDAIDVVVAFKWQDKVKTTGELQLTTGAFNPELRTRTTRGLEVDRIEQGLPSKLSVALRYADRLAPRPEGDGRDEADEANDTRLRDPMTEERWDIELDFEYQLNSHISATFLEPAVGQLVEFERVDGSVNSAQFPNPAIPENIVDRNWQNQIAVQLGASYNILPGVVALHTGVNFETRGVDPQYMNIDFWPVQRLGVHGGITLRVDRRIDITLSYGHIFQETISLAAPPHANRLDPSMEGHGIDKLVGVRETLADQGTLAIERNAPVEPDATANLEQELTTEAPGQPPYIVNAGHYRSNLDVIAVGIQMHF